MILRANSHFSLCALKKKMLLCMWSVHICDQNGTRCQSEAGLRLTNMISNLYHTKDARLTLIIVHGNKNDFPCSFDHMIGFHNIDKASTHKQSKHNFTNLRLHGSTIPHCPLDIGHQSHQGNVPLVVSPNPERPNGWLISWDQGSYMEL